MNPPLKKKLRIYMGNVAKAQKRFRARPDYGFRVLLYHSITDSLIDGEWEENTTPKELFETQMRYLADNGYNVIRCREAVEYVKENRVIPARTIAITFDDGYRDFHTNALPVLKKYNFCATLFLTVDFLRDYSGDMRYLDCREILDAKGSGLIDFGCHGLRHRALSILSERELDEEIVGAKERLRHLTGSEIELFAFPFGHNRSYNRKVADKVKSSGYAGSFTTISGLNDFKRDRFLLRRNRISWIDKPDEFKKHLSGAYDWSSLFECLRSKRYFTQGRKDMGEVLESARKRFKVGSADTAGREDIVNFFRAAYADQFNAADYKDEENILKRWKWANIENPAIRDKEFPAWFCRDKKKDVITGHLGIIPVSIKVKDRYYTAVWGRDMIVPSEWRKMGVASLMFDTIMKKVRENTIFFLLAGLNDYAVSIYKKLGFVHLGYIPLYIRIINLERVLQKRIRNRILLRLSSIIGSIFLNILYMPLRLEGKKQDRDIIISEISRFDGSFDVLWESASGFFPIIVRRDARSLNRRFVDQPYWEYKIFKAVDGITGELKGYVVLREGQSQGLRVGVVSDFFAHSGDTKTITALINFTIAYFKEKDNVDLIRCDILNRGFERLFKKAGFINATSKAHFMVADIKQNEIAPEFVTDRNNWFINYADCDLDLSEKR